jgi:predicted GIY-YIG superfamily endonuclease
MTRYLPVNPDIYQVYNLHGRQAQGAAAAISRYKVSPSDVDPIAVRYAEEILACRTFDVYRAPLHAVDRIEQEPGDRIVFAATVAGAWRVAVPIMWCAIEDSSEALRLLNVDTGGHGWKLKLIPDREQLNAYYDATVVYYLRSEISQRVYIGSTQLFHDRIKQHYSTLAQGCHHNAHLQHEYFQYGHKNMTWGIVEEVSKHLLQAREQHWINSCPSERRLNIDVIASARR